MTLHPVLDKIFDYGDDRIEELLNEHTVSEMKNVWFEKVPVNVRNQFKRQHKGADITEVLRYLCTKSTLKLCEECLAEDSTDRRR